MSLSQNIARAKTDYDDVYEAGRRSQYDEFWDAFQENGERRGYLRAFSNEAGGWANGSFKPKYDIICVGNANFIFYAWEKGESVDVGKILKQQGITIDTSKATSLTSAFAYTQKIIGELPTISCESAGANTSNLFRNIKVTRIEKFIVTEQSIFDASFHNVGALVDIVFEGTIATGKLDMSFSGRLSKASITSIINCLSTTTSGLAVTISKMAVNNAFETSAGAADGSTSTEWQTLIGTRANWTINLLDS